MLDGDFPERIWAVTHPPAIDAPATPDVQVVPLDQEMISCAGGRAPGIGAEHPVDVQLGVSRALSARRILRPRPFGPDGHDGREVRQSIEEACGTDGQE